jgi:hypothetical protein
MFVFVNIIADLLFRIPFTTVDKKETMPYLKEIVEDEIDWIEMTINQLKDVLNGSTDAAQWAHLTVLISDYQKRLDVLYERLSNC